MRILPIKSVTSFSGRTTDYNLNRGKEDLKRNSFWQKNSSVEEALGTYHNNKTGKVYFADPMENVSDKIKDSVDYVVYDNEPSYPDVNKEVKENYLGRLRKDFKKDFEEIRNYYYRREMGGFANVDEAKYQQAQAAHCGALYDKAGDLRYKKEKVEDEVSVLEKKNEKITQGILSSENELANVKKLLSGIDTQIGNLKQIHKSYQDIAKTMQEGLANEDNMDSAVKDRMMDYVKELHNSFVKVKYPNKNEATQAKEKNAYEKYNVEMRPYNAVKAANDEGYRLFDKQAGVKKEIAKLSKTLGNYQVTKQVAENTILEIQGYIDTLKQESEKIVKNITDKNALISDMKAKLSPLFDELKNYYATQGIRVIKK